MFNHYVESIVRLTATMIIVLVLVASCGKSEPTATPVPPTPTLIPPTDTPVSEGASASSEATPTQTAVAAARTKTPTPMMTSTETITPALTQTPTPGVGSTHPAATPLPIPSGMVDVGGYALFIACSGAGGPVVILEAGTGYGVGEWWGELPDQVAQFTQVCMYDRAGIGRSDPPIGEWRTAQDLADDLHRLLKNAGAEGPFVLVGHSLGGAIVRLYAAKYPDEVAGLVLLDSMNETYNEAEKDFLTPEEYARYADLMADSIEFSLSGTLEELYAMREGNDTPLEDLPLVVISRGTQPPSDLVSQEELQERLELWQELQADLATISINGVFIVAEESGHFVHLDQLDLVVEAIRGMIEGWR